MPPVMGVFIFSIKDITKMGLMLATLLVAKFLNSVIPDLPNGLGDLMPLLPITIIVGSLFMRLQNVILVLSIYIGIAGISPHIFISGIEGVERPINIFGVFILDYFIPLFALSIISIKTKYKYFLISLAVVVNYISHISSGVVFGGDYAGSGGGVWIYSITANAIQFSILLVTSISVTKIFSNHISGLVVQNGYVNDSYKVFVNGKGMQKRIPKHSIADGNNEKKVYSKLNIEIEFNEDGSFLKEGIPGKTVKKGNQIKLDSLSEQIKLFHSKDIAGISKHDGMVIKEYKGFISNNLGDEYKSLVNSFAKHKQVLSHNDINSHNVVGDGKNIHLIDFEGSRVNSIYYDYAQLMVAERIDILPGEFDRSVFNNMTRAIIIFNLLGTYSMPDSQKLLKLRTKYKKMLGI